MNRSLGAFGRCFSLLLITLLGGYTSNLLAEDATSVQEMSAEIEELLAKGKELEQRPPSEEIEALIQQGREARDDGSFDEEIVELSEQGKEALEDGSFAEAIEDIIEEVKRHQQTNPLDEDEAPRNADESHDGASRGSHENNLLIFASHSLKKQGLQELLENAAYYPKATVIFRGIPDGMNLGEGVKQIQRIAAKINPIPNVVINPMLFEQYGVTDVPTIVLLDGNPKTDKERVLASVRGLADPRWLLQMVQRGERGDQGVQGSIAAIQEHDLIKVMQQRAMAIDWQEKKRAALSRCWKNVPNYALPTATQRCTRVIDPTVVVTRDIVTPNGTVIAPAGSKINPLAVRPFTQLVVVFDPLDKSHLPRVNGALPKLKQQSGSQRVTYLATQFCPEKGWKGHQAISDAVAAPVYLLTPELIKRFELRVAPSIIHAARDHFLVEELADAQ